MSKVIVKSVLKAVMGTGIAEPFATMFVRECQGLIRGSNPDAPIVLAFAPGKFRGDLELLEKNGDFRVLLMPDRWRNRFLPWFYPGADLGMENFFDVRRQPSLAAQRDRYRRFLRAFWASVAPRLGIRAVMGAAVHYPQDLDWGASAAEVGIPYIVLHRENFVTNTAHRERYLNYLRNLGQFEGTSIIVQNDVVRDLFIASGFAQPDAVHNFGCMRMDDFVGRMTAPRPPRPRKQVVLFSFHHATGLLGLSQAPGDFKNFWSIRDGVGLVELFTSVHRAIGRFAAENPDVDVVVKTKWDGGWFQRIEQAVSGAGYDARELPNLKITYDRDAHELILGSDVAISFGSTTAVEAGAAGLPVIIPSYAEASWDKYANYIHLGDHYHLFDVAESEERLLALLAERLDNSTVSEDVLAERRELFGQLVSGLDGGATSKYIAHISQLIAVAKGPVYARKRPA